MHPDTATLVAYRDGELPGNTRRRVAMHLEECALCHREAARLEAEFHVFLLADAAACAAEPPDMEKGLAGVLRAAREWERERHNASAANAGQPRLSGSVPAFVLWGTAIHLAAGMGAWAAWLLTGNFVWMTLFFHYPGALFLVELAILGLRMSWMARRHLPPGDPRGTAWTLVTAASACHLAGAVLCLVLGAESAFNPLTRLPGIRPAETAAMLRGIGLSLAGFVSVTLLVGAVWSVLHAGVPRRNRCWGALCAAILLNLAGYVGILAAARGYLPLPWSAIGWFLWFPAAAALALGPLWQVESLGTARLHALERPHPAPARA